MPRPFALRALLPALAAVSLLAPAGAQQQRYGTVFMQTRVGSFKILGVAGLPAEGTIELAFTGTVLVNGTPKVVPAGKVRREYFNKEHQQQVYHGTGKLVVQGKFTSIQWFGRDMKCKWNGFGVARLVGEFDKNLKTGEYWYIDNPADIHDWGTSLTLITNPPRVGDVKLLPKLRPDKPGR